MLTSKRSSHACGTKCVEFFSPRSIDLDHKIENPLFFLWSWKNGRFSDPISLLHLTSSVRWSSTLNSNAEYWNVIAHMRDQVRWVYLAKEHRSDHKIENPLSFPMIVKIQPILRSHFVARPYLKRQVISDLKQQCRLVKGHRTHVGPSALSFSSHGASIWIIKPRVLWFRLWPSKNNRFSDPKSLLHLKY